MQRLRKAPSEEDLAQLRRDLDASRAELEEAEKEKHRLQNEVDRRDATIQRLSTLRGCRRC